MKRILIALALMAAATPALAQDYEVMGRVEVTMLEDSFTMWVPYDTEADEAFATLIGPKVMASLSIDAFAGEPGVELRHPRLVLGVTAPGPRAVPAGVTLYPSGTDDVYVAEEGTGSYTIDNVTMEGDTVSFDFEAVTVAVDMTTLEPLPEDKRIGLSGHAEVTLRDE